MYYFFNNNTEIENYFCLLFLFKMAKKQNELKGSDV